MKVYDNSFSLLLPQYIKPNVVNYGIVDGDKEWNYTKISSPFHRLYYIEDGEIFIRSNKDETIIEKGQICLVRSNTMMDYYAKGSFIEYYIHFQYPVFGGLDLLDRCNDIIRLDNENFLKERILDISLNYGIESFVKIQSILYEVLTQIIQKSDKDFLPQLKVDNRYEKLIACIEKNIDVKFNVESMAKKCGQSVSDFTRKFKKNIGLSPKAYLHNVILNKSKVLLATSNKSVKEIAYSLGYKDSLYFSRFFTKNCGMSPISYRRSQM